VAGCLRALLDDAARGAFPDPDGEVELLPAPAGPAAGAIVGFTAHFAVAAGVPAEWLRERLRPGDLIAPLSPPFLTALGARLEAPAGARCSRRGDCLGPARRCSPRRRPATRRPCGGCSGRDSCRSAARRSSSPEGAAGPVMVAP
jgi:hypothetical protein